MLHVMLYYVTLCYFNVVLYVTCNAAILKKKDKPFKKCCLGLYSGKNRASMGTSSCSVFFWKYDKADYKLSRTFYFIKSS